jgi:predicted nucleotidyltransferase
MKTVTNDLLDEMTQKLIAEFRPERVILFGSYAWGIPDKYSDVDLLVIVGHSDLSDYERAVLAHACLSEVDVPKDVIVKTRDEFDFYREVRASLEYKIARQGKVLYERSQETTRPKLAH